jgi:hypothetical protein
VDIYEEVFTPTFAEIVSGFGSLDPHGIRPLTAALGTDDEAVG